MLKLVIYGVYIAKSHLYLKGEAFLEKLASFRVQCKVIFLLLLALQFLKSQSHLINSLAAGSYCFSFDRRQG